MRKRKIKKKHFIQICLLRVTLAPFWRISSERKQHMLFCVSCATWILCFRSNQSVRTTYKTYPCEKTTTKKHSNVTLLQTKTQLQVVAPGHAALPLGFRMRALLRNNRQICKDNI